MNFPTKWHWRNPGRLPIVEAGLEDLRDVIDREDVRLIAIPALGCGLGGLDWSDVRPLVESAMSGFDELRAEVFEPS